MHITRKPPEAAVKKLLAAAQLPTTDITSELMEHFFVAWAGENLEGVVGLEPFGSAALLRSLAVVAPRRRSGLGSELLSGIERYAMTKCSGACRQGQTETRAGTHAPVRRPGLRQGEAGHETVGPELQPVGGRTSDRVSRHESSSSCPGAGPMKNYNGG